MRIVIAMVGALACAGAAVSQETISLSTQDGGTIYADVYGAGRRGVVLAHGGRFDKESWRPQADALARAGFRVVAFDFRGYSQSRGPKNHQPDDGRPFDVLAAVRYLRDGGATSISVVGASMGGDYSAEAAEAEPEAIDRLVLLAAGAYTLLVKMRGRALFIMARDDVIGDDKPRMPRIREQYERATVPKEFVVLDGSAHAQLVFATDQGERLLREILRFLTTP